VQHGERFAHRLARVRHRVDALQRALKILSSLAQLAGLEGAAAQVVQRLAEQEKKKDKAGGEGEQWGVSQQAAG
jgi:hypothetical protein